MRLVRLFLTFVVLVVMVSSGVAGATPVVVKNIATGIDDITGQKLAYGTPDTDYIIGAGSVEGGGLVPEAFQFVATGDSSDWVSDAASSESRWLALDISHPESTWDPSYYPVAPGTYSFLTQVDLTGFDASTAQLENLVVSVDDGLLEIVINGASVFSQSHQAASQGGAQTSFQALGTFGAGSMQNGINLIEFRVGNGSVGANPMGLRLEGVVTAAAVPEPSTALLLGLGLAGIAIRKRR